MNQYDKTMDVLMTLWQVESRIQDEGIQVGSRTYSIVEDPTAVDDIFVSYYLCKVMTVQNHLNVVVDGR